MNQTFGAVALGVLLAASGAAAAHASVPLPVLAQASGMRSLAPILKKITPAVVSIAIKSRAADAVGQQPHKTRDAKSDAKTDHKSDTRLAPPDQPARAAGSGVIIDARQGLVITNHHVIDHADEITVQLADGRELTGKLIGSDPVTDIAAVRIAPESLTGIAAGNSDQIEVGDFVLTIGNPFLIGQTVTSGIVSGLNRTNVGLEQIEDFIQTDAAIYPGNSGGALVNLRGELIGISTAFIGASNANAGMGFAVPINMARRVVDRIVETGDLRRGRLGIMFEDSTPALVREFKLLATPVAPVITKVDPGSPADLAGLKAGDVVTNIGGTPVRDMSRLRTHLGLLFVGDTADISIMRDGKPAVIRVTIADPRRARAQK